MLPLACVEAGLRRVEGAEHGKRECQDHLIGDDLLCSLRGLEAERHGTARPGHDRGQPPAQADIRELRGNRVRQALVAAADVVALIRLAEDGEAFFGGLEG
jgi:hypothetical protein